MTPAAHRPGDMRRRVVRGLVWVGASQITLQLTRAIVAIVVARLLTPTDYGLAALALVFASLVLVFSDLALGAALIQRKTITEADKDTAFWTTLASGVAFMILGVAAAGPIASIYGEQAVEPLLVALSASFVLAALGATQQSLMLRDMEFKRIEVLTMGGTIAGAIAGVAVAAGGGGAWAIIAQQIASTAITTALVWMRSPWRPGRSFSKASLRDMWAFSGFLVGHRLLYYVHQNADRFLIGRFVGPAALGAYAIAYNTMLVPASRIGGPLQRVLAPAFSRMQDEPERIAAAWSRATRLLASIAVPALGGLVVVAPDFVHVALGEKWESAVPMVQILAWVGILQALQSLNVDILMARDRTSTIFRFSIGFCTVHLLAFVIGLHWGVVGVAVAYAISSTLVEPIMTVLTARTLEVSPWLFVRSVAGVFAAAGVMCLVVLATRLALVDAGVGSLGRLAICVVTGMVVYVGLCAWRVPDIARDVRALLGRGADVAPLPVARPLATEA